MSPEVFQMMADVAAKHPHAFAELMASSKNGKSEAHDKPQSTESLLDVITQTEAATYLQLPEEVVRAEATAGRLIGRAVGDGWRFVREDVLKWVRTPSLASMSPGYQETEEEYQAYWASILAFRDEVDRLHNCGKYAEEE